MDPKTITKWLKTTGKDRAWLADQCQVAKSTVNGWLAAQKPRPIPKPSLSIIAGLMYSETPISPRFTLQQFAAMQTAARKEGKTLEDWISGTVLEKLAKTVVLGLLLYPLSILF